MATRKDIFAHCVVRDNSAGDSPAQETGQPRGCEIVDSVQKLMALGLSAGEIEQLGMAEGALDALCEYARLGDIPNGEGSKAVREAIRTLANEAHKVDLELEMLKLRRRALTRRGKLLHKLAAMLQERECA